MVDGADSTGLVQTPFVARSLVVLRLACAGVLGFAAAAKLLSPAVTAEFLSNLTHRGPVIGWVSAVALIAVEAAAAVLLLLPRYASKGGALAAVMGLGSLLYRSFWYVGGDCPCFGGLVRVAPATSWLLGCMLLGAGCAVALAGCLPPAAADAFRGRPRRAVRRYAAAFLALIMVTSASAVMHTVKAKRGSAATLTAAARAGLSLGQAVPETTVIVDGRPLALAGVVGDQRTVVSFLSLDCAACRVYVQRLVEVLGEVPQARAVLVVPDARQLNNLQQRIAHTDHCTFAVRGVGELRSMLPNPTHLLIDGRRIARVTSSTSEVAAWLRRGPDLT